MAPKGGNKGRASAKGGRKDVEPVSKSHDTQVTLPSWPLLKPLVPTIDLALETVLESQIILVRRFFTASLCQNYISFLSSLPLTTTPGQPKKGEAVRVNDRFQIQDPDFARRLWETTPLQELVQQSHMDWGGQVCGLNPNIRIYRYRPGQFFDQHYDESNIVMLPGNPEVTARTTWTLLIYLSGPGTGCEGGETVFYPEGGSAKGMTKKNSKGIDPVAVVPEVGLALLHKHGDDCLLHEGRMVSAGEKWIIRSDLCVVK